MSPRDSRFTTNTDVGKTEYEIGDGQELKWEFDEEHVCDIPRRSVVVPTRADRA